MLAQVIVGVTASLCLAAAAPSPVTLEEGAEELSLNSHASLLVDTTQAMTLEQVLAQPPEAFKHSDALGLGYTKAATWVRFTVRSALSTPSEWYLEAGYVPIHALTFYVPARGGAAPGYTALPMGLTVDYDDKPVKVATYVAPLKLDGGQEVTVYARITGHYSLHVPFKIYSAPALHAHVARQESFNGAYYGLVLVMILYNLLLYFSLKDQNYLTYVLTLVFLHLFLQTAFLGHFHQYLGELLPWIDLRAIPLFAFLGIGFGVHFSRGLMRTRELAPRWDKFLFGVAAFSAAMVPLTFVLPVSVADQIALLAGAVSAITLIVVGAVEAKRGYSPAKYFLLAWSSLLVADIIHTLKFAKVLPSMFLTDKAVLIGSALEVVLLSLALGDRINLLRREKEAAQQAALEREKESAEAQAKLVEHLKRMDKLKDEILANTSHELRTPLNGITGLAESMLDGVAGGLPALANKNLTMIVASARRLGTLVNDILDFSKMKQDRMSLSVEPVDLREVVETVLALSGSLIGKKPLQLKNEIPEGLPAVAADHNRLQQVLHNLVGNSVKFTEQGQIQVTARVDADRIEVRISDTGIGIAPENQERIFEAFEQGDGSTAREYGGTGLGLAVTKKLVELHGGQIGVTSTVGKGSTFFFTLPLSNEQPRVRTEEVRIRTDEAVPAEAMASAPIAASEPAAPALTAAVPAGSNGATGHVAPAPLIEAPSGVLASVQSNVALAPVSHALSVPEPTDVRILVVDDEPINQAVLANILSMQSYGIHQALNGFEALDALEKMPFDLVLLDIMMPKMSGYEVCKRIRERFAIAQLPVLMLTAKTQVADLVEGFNAGANDYVAKPFSKRELLSRIRTHLQLSRMTAAAERFVPYEFLSYLKKESLADVKLGDQVQREMTVLFSDIRSYTTLSEAMTPEENFLFLNRYFGELAPLISSHHGFIDKFIGDAIMALFDRSPLDSVASAVEMQRKLREFNEERIRAGKPPVAAGTGINTGSLMLGAIGHERRMQSTVISDAVNVAARLESLSKVFKASIIIGADTYRRCADDKTFQARCLGKVRVKGKTVPVAIYEVVDGYTQDVIEKKLATRPDFERGIEAWQRGDHAECERLMRGVLDQNNQDQAALLYINRCRLVTKNLAPPGHEIEPDMALLV